MKTTQIKWTLLLAALYSSAGLLLTSCSPNMGFGNLRASSIDDGSGQIQGVSKYDVNLHPMNKTICDPMGGGLPPDVDKGIQASLYYSNPGTTRLYSAMDYVDRATKSTQSLFFTDMNVPTRLFTAGFATQTSSVVKDDTGQELIEFFGLQFETILRLSPDQAEGDYELGILADDGAVVKAQINGQWRPVISIDGDHPTTMGCALATINMTHDSAIPLEVTYYQGPRYHIANVLMWRPSSTAGQDPLCGHSGNNYFFDPDHGSAQMQPYKDLLARNWVPISSNNFYLPSTAGYNPCTEGTAPAISGFIIPEIESDAASVQWTTDIPATSQVLITNVATGEEILTPADNVLRTLHQVRLTGLDAGVTYTAQAVSVSGDLGKAMSSPLTFTTPM